MGELEAAVRVVGNTKRSRVSERRTTGVVPGVVAGLRVHQTKAVDSLVADVKRKVLTSLVNRLRSLEAVGVCVVHRRTIHVVTNRVEAVVDNRGSSHRTVSVSHHRAVRVRNNNRRKSAHREQLVQGVHHVVKTTSLQRTFNRHTRVLDVLQELTGSRRTIFRGTSADGVDVDSAVCVRHSLYRVNTPLIAVVKQDSRVCSVQSEVKVLTRHVRTRLGDSNNVGVLVDVVYHFLR